MHSCMVLMPIAAGSSEAFAKMLAPGPSCRTDAHHASDTALCAPSSPALRVRAEIRNGGWAPIACRGFTLAEILISIAILSILSAVAFPRFRDFQTASESRSAARAMVLTLKRAQQRAAMLNRPAVAFFPDSSHLSLYVDLDLDGTADLPSESSVVRVPGQTWWAGYSSYELPGKRSLSVSGFPVGSSGKPQVTLRSDGTVSSAGNVTMRDSRGTTYLLQVTPTGAIGLSRLDGA
jgi:prepilin-type N-terminal cleavage/methylation domain-containing protein